MSLFEFNVSNPRFPAVPSPAHAETLADKILSERSNVKTKAYIHRLTPQPFESMPSNIVIRPNCNRHNCLAARAPNQRETYKRDDEDFATELDSINPDIYEYVYVILCWMPSFDHPAIYVRDAKNKRHRNVPLPRFEEWGYVHLAWLYHNRYKSDQSIPLSRDQCTLELNTRQLKSEGQLSLSGFMPSLTVITRLRYESIRGTWVEQAISSRIQIFIHLRTNRMNSLPDMYIDVAQLLTPRAVALDCLGFYFGMLVFTRTGTLGFDSDEFEIREWKRCETLLFEYRLRCCISMGTACYVFMKHVDVFSSEDACLKYLSNSDQFKRITAALGAGTYCATSNWELAVDLFAEKKTVLVNGAAVFKSCYLFDCLAQQYSKQFQDVKTFFERGSIRSSRIHSGLPFFEPLKELACLFKGVRSNPMMNPVFSVAISLPTLRAVSPPCVQAMLHQLNAGCPRVHLKYSQRNITFNTLLQVNFPAEDIEDLMQKGIPKIYPALTTQREKRKKLAYQLKYAVTKNSNFHTRCNETDLAKLCPYRQDQSVCAQHLSSRLETNVPSQSMYSPVYFIRRQIGRISPSY